MLLSEMTCRFLEDSLPIIEESLTINDGVMHLLKYLINIIKLKNHSIAVLI